MAEAALSRLSPATAATTQSSRGDATAADIDNEVKKMLDKAYEEAKKIISENMEALDRIAAYLIEKETITGKEFMDILNEVRNKDDIVKEEDQ